ncbi:MAG TPA: hypothetical protein VJR29_11925 [bacterium]|nr:hypothetical protein [bacterium]
MLAQTAMFGGLMTAHMVEERLGLRQHVDGATTITDTLASMFSLGIGASLAHRALGPRYAAMQGELNWRFKAYSNPVKLSESPLALQPMMMAAAGGRGDGSSGSGHAGKPAEPLPGFQGSLPKVASRVGKSFSDLGFSSELIEALKAEGFRDASDIPRGDVENPSYWLGKTQMKWSLYRELKEKYLGPFEAITEPLWTGVAIEKMQFSPETTAALKSAGIEEVRQLQTKTWLGVLNIPGISRQSAFELKDRMAEAGHGFPPPFIFPEPDVSPERLQFPELLKKALERAGLWSMKRLTNVTKSHLLATSTLSREEIRAVDEHLKGWGFEIKDNHTPTWPPGSPERLPFSSEAPDLFPPLSRQLPLKALKLPRIVHRAIRESGIRGVEELVGVSSKWLLERTTLSWRDLQDLNKRLRAFGLRLNDPRDGHGEIPAVAPERLPFSRGALIALQKMKIRNLERLEKRAPGYLIYTDQVTLPDLWGIQKEIEDMGFFWSMEIPETEAAYRMPASKWAPAWAQKRLAEDGIRTLEDLLMLSSEDLARRHYLQDSDLARLLDMAENLIVDHEMSLLGSKLDPMRDRDEVFRFFQEAVEEAERRGNVLRPAEVAARAIRLYMIDAPGYGIHWDTFKAAANEPDFRTRKLFDESSAVRTGRRLVIFDGSAIRAYKRVIQEAEAKGEQITLSEWGNRAYALYCEGLTPGSLPSRTAFNNRISGSRKNPELVAIAMASPAIDRSGLKGRSHGRPRITDADLLRAQKWLEDLNIPELSDPGLRRVMKQMGKAEVPPASQDNEAAKIPSDGIPPVHPSLFPFSPEALNILERLGIQQLNQIEGSAPGYAAFNAYTAMKGGVTLPEIWKVQDEILNLGFPCFVTIPHFEEAYRLPAEKWAPPAAQAKLTRDGVHTLGDLLKIPKSELVQREYFVASELERLLQAVEKLEN